MFKAAWETLDVAELLRRDELPESTVSANVGPFTVPIGPVLRRQSPETIGLGDYDFNDIPEAYRDMLGLGRKR